MKPLKVLLLTLPVIATGYLAPSTVSAMPITMDSFSITNFSFGPNEVTAARAPYSATANNQSTDYRFVSVDGFDSSLGDLIAASFSYTSTYSLGASIEALDTVDSYRRDCDHLGHNCVRTNDFDLSRGTTDGTLQLTVAPLSLPGPGSSTTVAIADNCHNESITPEKCSSTSSRAGVFNGSLSPDFASLPDLTDTVVNFELSRILGIEVDSRNRQSEAFGSVFSNDWVGSISAQYSYTPYIIATPVPEPNSIALLGLGILSMMLFVGKGVGQKVDYEAAA